MQVWHVFAPGASPEIPLPAPAPNACSARHPPPPVPAARSVLLVAR
jgi:hypothetical protein